MSTNTRHIETYVREGVAYIYFNRPEKKNAMTKEMWDALASNMKKFCRDPHIVAVVLRGRGGAFTAGDDIKEMHEITSVEEARSFFSSVADAFASVLSCERPVIAVVEGPAVGGGAELLLATDIVIASRNSVIGFPEARIGLIPPVLSTLGALVLGYRRAKALALSGALLGAQEARDIGLVDLIADSDVIDNVLAETINLLKRSPTTALAEIKKTFLASIRPAFEAAITKLELLVLCKDAKERLRGFLEGKRY